MEPPLSHTRTRSMPVGQLALQRLDMTDFAAPTDLEDAASLLMPYGSRSPESFVQEASRSINYPEKIRQCGKNSGRWVYQHKGTLTLVVVCGVICFYVGSRLTRVATLCDDAGDVCLDAVHQCGDAARLLGTCTGQIAILKDFINTLLKNGTQVCVSAARECMDNVEVVRELCKMCKNPPPMPSF